MRLGSIEFINSLPVDLGILSGAVASDFDVISSTPAALNQMIADGNLEVSPVSAFWYALNHEDLVVLPELSISSQSGVQSVLVFSREPLASLKGKRIAVTDKGKTTPALLEILCRMRYGFRPQTVKFTRATPDVPAGCDAMLLIGDDALIHRKRLEARGLKATDLAEEWRAWTGLPFVFALWTARRDALMRRPEAVLRLYQALLDSKQWGLSHLPEVLKASQERSGLSDEDLKSYFSVLRYDFDPELQRGVKAYFGHAVECGLIPSLPTLEMLPTGEREGARQAEWAR